MAASEANVVRGARRPADGAVPPAPSSGPAPLRAALASEWVKLRSIPHPHVYGIAAVLLGAGWAAAGSLVNRDGFLTAAAERGDAMVLGPMIWLGVTRFTIVVAIMLGATLLTSERESGTAVVTRIVLPHSGAVYGAKLAWSAVAGLVIGAVAGIAVPLAVWIVLGPAATGFTVAPALLLGYGLRVAIVTALCAVAGVALGALTRSLLITAALAFAWVWFENLIASMLGEFANLFVLTPWRNLSYFIDGSGYGLPYLWDSAWGFAPLAVLTLVLVLAGGLRHRADTHTTQE